VSINPLWGGLKATKSTPKSYLNNHTPLAQPTKRSALRFFLVRLVLAAAPLQHHTLGTRWDSLPCACGIRLKQTSKVLYHIPVRSSLQAQHSSCSLQSQLSNERTLAARSRKYVVLWSCCMYPIQRLVTTELERGQFPRRYDAWRSCERTPRVPTTGSYTFNGGSAHEITQNCAVFGTVQYLNYTGFSERPDRRESGAHAVFLYWGRDRQISNCLRTPPVQDEMACSRPYSTPLHTAKLPKEYRNDIRIFELGAPLHSLSIDTNCVLDMKRTPQCRPDCSCSRALSVSSQRSVT